MAELPPRQGWSKAFAIGAVLLGIGLLIGHFTTKSSGDYSGFWGGLSANEPSAAGQGLAPCPTAKCLTVYVAPWCPHCRNATPGILALRDYLKQRDVHTNIIVGMDRPAALAAYAKTFGPDTVLDEKGELASGGVPHFYVTDKAGYMLKDQAGAPEPMPDSATMASFFDLP